MAAVTSRYARALAEVVFERKLDVDQTVAALDTFAGALSSTPALRQIWDNPAVPAEQKRKVLDALMKHIGGDRMVRNFVALLIDNRRIVALPEIARQFRAELNQRMGIAEADVTTIRELSADEKRALESKIAKLTGKKVMARYAKDPHILGGAVVKIGSTVYDGSVKGKLQRLKETLSN